MLMESSLKVVGRGHRPSNRHRGATTHCGPVAESSALLQPRLCPLPSNRSPIFDSKAPRAHSVALPLHTQPAALASPIITAPNRHRFSTHSQSINHFTVAFRAQHFVAVWPSHLHTASRLICSCSCIGRCLTHRSRGRCAIKPRSAPELKRYAQPTYSPPWQTYHQ